MVIDNLIVMRVLEISFDSYLINEIPADAEYEWLPAGRSLNPRQDRKIARDHTISKYTAIKSILSRKYDVVIIPAVHVNNTGDFSWPVKLAKKIFKIGSRVPLSGELCARVLRWFADYWIVFDHHDLTMISEEVLKLVKPEIYFKRNLLSKLQSSDNQKFELLPMPMPRENMVKYENLDKVRDVFIGGTYETELRKNLLRFSKGLKESGVDIDIVDQRVSPEEFANRMASAKICFATQGIGYHTWRMYEAPLCGSVVILNEPEEDVVHFWRDGENCLMHNDNLEEFMTKLNTLLGDDSKLANIQKAGTEMVMEKHSLCAVSAYLWKRIGTLVNN